MTDTATGSAPVAKAPKARQVDNFYIDAAGNRSTRPQADVMSVGKKFLESGTEIVVSLADLPESSQRQCMAFGLIQVGSNAYGTAGSEDERMDMCEDRYAAIKSGSWSQDRQTGPRTSDIIEAFAQAKKDDTGQDVDDAWRQKIATLLEEGKQITSKGLLENPAVASKYYAIKAQRALERSQKAQAATAGNKAVALPDL